ncbi:MAG: hypothetical protein Q9M39_08875 [Sulfurovum sp.]|nr:hypothetical protein [Sulfurovum sp.]
MDSLSVQTLDKKCENVLVENGEYIFNYTSNKDCGFISLTKVENKATLKLEEYIVKSWGKEYPELALNEYYCMKVVKYAN